MNVCYEKEFIFLHVPRTGGTSIRKSLGSSCELIVQAGDHEDMADIRRVIGRNSSIWQDYVKFAFVRNPWDRLVSAFFYLSDDGTNFVDKRVGNLYIAKYDKDFQEFVKNIVSWFDAPAPFVTYKHGKSPHLRQQVHFLCDEAGKVDLGFVGRYEKLEDDYEYITEILDLEVPPLTRELASEHRDYREYYDDETIDIVAKYYSDDISTFNYSF